MPRGTVGAMRMRRAAAALVLVGVVGACSSPPYTRADAEADLAEQTDLTDEQIECVLDRVEQHYADEYESLQRENGVDEVSEQQTEVYVKNAIAAAEDPTEAEIEMFDEAVAACT